MRPGGLNDRGTRETGRQRLELYVVQIQVGLPGSTARSGSKEIRPNSGLAHLGTLAKLAHWSPTLSCRAARSSGQCTSSAALWLQRCTCLLPTAFWWGRRDSNPHALRHMILSHARLPVPTRPRTFHSSSGAAVGLDGNFARLRYRSCFDRDLAQPPHHERLEWQVARWKRAYQEFNTNRQCWRCLRTSTSSVRTIKGPQPRDLSLKTST